MDAGEIFAGENRERPFAGYEEYMEYLFGCVNETMDHYLSRLKQVYATGQGGYKNVLYPDIEIAHDTCRNKLEQFTQQAAQDGSEEPAQKDVEEPDWGGEDPDLLDLFADFAGSGDSAAFPGSGRSEETAEEMIAYINTRAGLSVEQGIALPFHDLCRRLDFENFTIFCLAASILASTQTDYAGVFQVINENGNLSAPTIESAAKLYYGGRFSITGAYGDMSVCLEQLLPLLDLRVQSSMPFSTVVSPDKRVIDFLFGKHPLRLDENYVRFFQTLTGEEELDPIMANEGVLEAMEISYNEGVRIFSYYGDEGSGRKFFIKHFCARRGLRAISINCKKLFDYDFSFVDKALWAVTRECILTGACCCLSDLSYREEEKEKFFGYMDLAFSKLTRHGLLVFALSKEKLSMKDMTKEEYTELELPTPSNQEREDCWNYYAKNYALAEDVDLSEMVTKFLFTPGKIRSALHQARSFATMDKDLKIPRATLFRGCNNQMSSELTQKATKVKANFGFEDIVMNRDQRETLEHAIDQMTYRKQVYDNWNYTKKYPYGRGLSILLFGAPGTGKSMCAQVIAHELNLELYRVDLSKVIDKYVGETEKSISMIFREAKKCNVVLFFDECDTLFAKRSDDGGSNQSSNNNKTALLLQEVEAYDGVSVRATNYKQNIDPAFFRRMKYIVEFQFPDADTREMLWKTTIPKGTPLGEDVDIRFLAEKFEFVGGNIKNCILNAAFLAAADGDGQEVCMKHYLQAIRYEFVKTGKVFTRSDFEPYASLIGL
ncbi:MAG: ATP-binding protein [Lachnospiraceae bacterium]|nr:ATP-binding protein [Lachnospiraceae bacterium]